MTTEDRLGAERRAAAIAALALAVATLVAGTFALAGDLGRAIVGPLLLLVVIAAASVAATRTGVVRLIAIGTAIAGLVAVAIVVLTSEGRGFDVLFTALLLGASVWCTRYALRRDMAGLKARRTPGQPVAAAQRGVLIMNPRSGGGKAEQFSLVDECHARGIEPVVLQPGDDLLQLARDAIDGGADVIGMAGGDGSQALVASVAMTADIPLVCIPAGTRNHFALDLGLDRADVVGALDAFGSAVERRIDLAEVGDRVFVNNVSLGVYAKIVQSDSYRDAKRQTTAAMLPELLGPDAEKFDLQFTDHEGVRHPGAELVMVSNNAYILSSLAGFGSRPRLDTGLLGITAAEIDSASDMTALVAAEAAGHPDRYRGWTEWEAPTFTIDSHAPVEAGVDGEALLLDPPLEFRILPAALRVRIPTSAPGYSPAALRTPSPWWTITALLRTAAGHHIPIEH